MPQPVANSLKRMTANPSRPARHRPGKVVAEQESSDEDDEEEEQHEHQAKVEPKVRSKGPARAQIAAKEDEVDNDADDDDEEGFVTEDEDDIPGSESIPGTTKDRIATTTKATARSRPPVLKHSPGSRDTSSDEGAEGESSAASETDDESGSDAETSSSSEPPKKQFQRPTFIKKTDRKSAAPSTNIDQPHVDDVPETERPGTASVPSIISATTLRTHVDSARRLTEAESLIKQRIERDTLARLQGRKNWDDDDDLPPEALVDDTDGLDPATEHSAWRLRELQRLKRDREALVALEKELEEVERRRGLTVEEREKEDREHLDHQKAAKDGRSQAAYLAKYHHKGAFFMDEDNEAVKRLREREFAGAKFQDEVADKSSLPEYLRVRDGTKIGKKGRTRYTDLKGEDTGQWGRDVKHWKGSGYTNDTRGDGFKGYEDVDERFRPDTARDGGGPSASGANASAIGQRRRRSRSPESMEMDVDRYESQNSSYRPRRQRGRSYSKSRSRSRSRDSKRSRSPRPRSRRSPSPYRDRDRDKRRRIEV